MNCPLLCVWRNDLMAFDSLSKSIFHPTNQEKSKHENLSKPDFYSYNIFTKINPFIFFKIINLFDKKAIPKRNGLIAKSPFIVLKKIKLLELPTNTV